MASTFDTTPRRARRCIAAHESARSGREPEVTLVRAFEIAIAQEAEMVGVGHLVEALTEALAQ